LPNVGHSQLQNGDRPSDVLGSPLDRLTEKQRKIIISAYRLGYYDVPRKMHSEKLANRMKLSRATLVEHLNKAERRLLSRIIDDA
jgi:predicted DNA binding protein